MAFEKGTSGNPKGRPKNVGFQQKLFNEVVRPRSKELLQSALEMALSGASESLMKVFIERLLPKRIIEDEKLIEVDKLDSFESLTRASSTLIQAAVNDEISAANAAKLTEMLTTHSNLLIQSQKTNEPEMDFNRLTLEQLNTYSDLYEIVIGKKENILKVTEYEKEAS